MRKLFVLFALATMVVVACEKEKNDNWDYPIIDWSPIVFYISVENASGASLLDASTEGALDLALITVEIDGEVFNIENLSGEISTLDYMPHLYGLRLNKMRDGKTILTVGEWAGDETVELREVTLNWGDGTSDKLGYKNIVTYNDKYRNDADRNWGHTFDREAYLNGDVVEGAFTGDSPVAKLTIVK